MVAGGDCVTGHDPATGAELWRWGTWNPGHIGHWRLVPSPVTSGETVLACAPKGSPVFAIKGGLTGAHTDESALAWRSKLSDEEMPSKAYKNVSSDVATPVFYQGHYYIVNGEKQTIACVKPGTGEVMWHEPLGGRTKIEGSPSAADGKIFVMDHRGDVYVVRADPAKFEVLCKAEMAEGPPSPAASAPPSPSPTNASSSAPIGHSCASGSREAQREDSASSLSSTRSCVGLVP